MCTCRNTREYDCVQKSKWWYMWMCVKTSQCGVYGRVQVTMHVYMREHKSVHGCESTSECVCKRVDVCVLLSIVPIWQSTRECVCMHVRVSIGDVWACMWEYKRASRCVSTAECMWACVVLCGYLLQIAISPPKWRRKAHMSWEGSKTYKSIFSFTSIPCSHGIPKEAPET